MSRTARCTPGQGDYQINQWKPEDFTAHMQFMKAFNKGLREAGELVGAEGLAPPSQARIVRAQSETGAPEVLLKIGRLRAS
jgi:hypothetical protein